MKGSFNKDSIDKVGHLSSFEFCCYVSIQQPLLLSTRSNYLKETFFIPAELSSLTIKEFVRKLRREGGRSEEPGEKAEEVQRVRAYFTT